MFDFVTADTRDATIGVVGKPTVTIKCFKEKRIIVMYNNKPSKAKPTRDAVT